MQVPNPKLAFKFLGVATHISFSRQRYRSDRDCKEAIKEVIKGERCAILYAPPHKKQRGTLFLMGEVPLWGSTSFWMCKVQCWRWLFGNKKPISLQCCKGRSGGRYFTCVSLILFHPLAPTPPANLTGVPRS